MSAEDIDANNRAFEHAIDAGNLEAIAALLAPDVMALPPDGPLAIGKEAVRQLWASAMRDHGLTGCRITTDHLDFAGDVASEVGHATLTMAAPNGTSQSSSVKFVVVWKRLDGKWLLHRDIWNAN